MSEITSTTNGTFDVASSDMRGKVERFEQLLRNTQQTAVPVQHHVNGGMYARSGLIPAGTSFVGAVHKKDHINIVCGDVTVLTDDGPTRYTGYCVMPCAKGSKRVAFAHADTMWTTLLRTDLADVEDIENESVEGSDELQSRFLKLESK